MLRLTRAQLRAHIADAVARVARWVGLLQQGRIAVYLMFSFATLIALLVVVGLGGATGDAPSVALAAASAPDGLGATLRALATALVPKEKGTGPSCSGPDTAAQP